jgi:hypothetical protein
MNKSEQISNVESRNDGNSDGNIPMDSIGRKSVQSSMKQLSSKDHKIFAHNIILDRCSPGSHHSARSYISQISKTPHPQQESHRSFITATNTIYNNNLNLDLEPSPIFKTSISNTIVTTGNHTMEPDLDEDELV